MITVTIDYDNDQIRINGDQDRPIVINMRKPIRMRHMAGLLYELLNVVPARTTLCQQDSGDITVIAKW